MNSAEIGVKMFEYNNKLLEYLDKTCVDAGFTGEEGTRPFRSIANYVGYTNAFQIPAETLGIWVADVFAVVEQLKNDVLIGNATMPNTFEELVALLPPKPIVN